jgi:hypothetical protein
MIEAKYIDASKAVKEAVWIRNFVSELGVVPRVFSLMDIYCDNSGAIAQTKKPRADKKCQTCTMTLASHP